MDPWIAAGSSSSNAMMLDTARVPMDPNESKREKRRREMVERVERLRRDTIDRKDAIYADLQGSFNLSLGAMLSHPDPNHPEYLLRLFAHSTQRDADILAARLEAAYAKETAEQLYHNEVERVEDEYEAAKKAIKDKLLEACDERAKKLREDKDSLELAGLGDMLDAGHAKHATRRRGNLAAAAATPVNGGNQGEPKFTSYSMTEVAKISRRRRDIRHCTPSARSSLAHGVPSNGPFFLLNRSRSRLKLIATQPLIRTHFRSIHLLPLTCLTSISEQCTPPFHAPSPA
jgi:hypothetical protein